MNMSIHRFHTKKNQFKFIACEDAIKSLCLHFEMTRLSMSFVFSIKVFNFAKTGNLFVAKNPHIFLHLMQKSWTYDCKTTCFSTQNVEKIYLTSWEVRAYCVSYLRRCVWCVLISLAIHLTILLLLSSFERSLLQFDRYRYRISENVETE